MELTDEQVKEIQDSINDRDLKIQGLLDRVGTQAQNYENLVADLRIEVTKITNERDSLKKEVEQLREQLTSLQPQQPPAEFEYPTGPENGVSEPQAVPDEPEA